MVRVSADRKKGKIQIQSETGFATIGYEDIPELLTELLAQYFQEAELKKKTGD